MLLCLKAMGLWVLHNSESQHLVTQDPCGRSRNTNQACALTTRPCCLPYKGGHANLCLFLFLLTMGRLCWTDLIWLDSASLLVCRAQWRTHWAKSIPLVRGVILQYLYSSSSKISQSVMGSHYPGCCTNTGDVFHAQKSLCSCMLSSYCKLSGTGIRFDFITLNPSHKYNSA